MIIPLENIQRGWSVLSIINANQSVMKNFLNQIYYIPVNQRDYSWGVDEVSDFWDDFLLVIRSKEKGNEHFFGQIVIFIDENKNKFIIDGQQRTITSMIFMRAVQYVCQKVKEENELGESEKNGVERLLSEITSNVLGRPQDEWSSESLHLNFEDAKEESEYFARGIIDGIPTDRKIKKQPALERMRAAYRYLYDQVREEIEELSTRDKIKRLHEYKDAFLEKFKVMYLETDDIGEAYIIFETLNARGKDLETADLLKNYVFSKAKGNIKKVQEDWKGMIESLDGLDTTKYIRYYWNSCHKFVREKELYKHISSEIKSPLNCSKLVDSLYRYSKCYHDAIAPENFDYYNDEEIIKHLKSLNELKASSYVPILLAMEMRGFSDVDKAEILKAIEIYVFRNATIAGKTSNKTEVFFADIADKVYNETLDKKSDIIARIEKQMIDDNAFKNIFRDYATTTRQYIRYIFIAIHEYLSPNTEINRDYKNVHIEHIMPRDIKLWENITAKEHEQYLWRLGNLALLDVKLNTSIANKPFEEKKNKYLSSQIKPNDELSKYNKWGVNEIRDRQNRLTDLAMKIWNKSINE